mgnify:CR=1 FL=1
MSDIDESTDLAHAISCIRAIKQSAAYQPGLFVPQRVLDWVDFMGIRLPRLRMTSTIPVSTSTSKKT